MVQITEYPLKLTTDLDGSWTRLQGEVGYQACLKKTGLSTAEECLAVSCLLTDTKMHLGLTVCSTVVIADIQPLISTIN